MLRPYHNDRFRRRNCVSNCLGEKRVIRLQARIPPRRVARSLKIARKIDRELRVFLGIRDKNIRPAPRPSIPTRAASIPHPPQQRKARVRPNAPTQLSSPKFLPQIKLHLPKSATFTAATICNSTFQNA
jgi:hypothetical protein